MSEEAYETVLPEALIVTDEEMKTPYMPLGTFFQEAEDLYVWAMQDIDELMATGLPETIFTKLQLRTDASRHAQSLWMGELEGRQNAEEEWAIESPKAYDLRNQLLHTFRYAYRNHESALTIVNNIADGSGDADMIQDLSSAAVLAQKYPDPLTAINFDFSLTETADALSGTMASLRALANGEKLQENETLATRNKMYTLLKETIDEIRDCGKYVFWRNTKRVVGYSSKYNRSKSH